MANSREFSSYSQHREATGMGVEETADETGNNALHDAIIQSDAVSFITILLDRGYNIYAKNYDNYTPLDLAIQYNRTESTSLLIRKGALVGEDLNSLLLMATEKDNHIIIKMLIDHGMQYNSSIDLKILNAAIFQGNPKIIESIIPHCGFSKPADLFIPRKLVIENNLNLWLPLSATEQNNQTQFRMILDHGMQNKQFIDFRNFHDVTITRRNQTINDPIQPHSLYLGSTVKWMSRNLEIKPVSQTEECVRLLLKWNFTIHPDSHHDKYFVYAAVEKGYLEIVLQLLKYGIDVNMVDSETGLNLLAIACINKHHEIVEQLLKHGTDVNVKIHADNIKLYNQLNRFSSIKIDISSLNHYVGRSSHITCLHISVFYSDPVMTEILLRHGAKIINDPTFFNITCQAICDDCEEIVRIFLDHGVNVTDIDPQGRTLLHFCILSDDCERSPSYNIAKMLLERGASIYLQTPGNTFVYEAIDNRDYGVAQLFLDYNADVQYVSPDGDSLLHKAIEKDFDIEFIKTLLKLNSPADVNNAKGLTPLHVTCKIKSNNYLEIIETLLQYNVDVNCTDNFLETPLHIACNAQNLELVTALLEKKANPISTDHLGQTPLHTICKYKGNTAVTIIQSLLKHNVNIEAVDAYCLTPLFVACKAVNYDAIKCLLDNNANPNVRNANDFTPLHYVCEYKDNIELKNSIIQLLLEHNANIDAIDGRGWTPLIVACERADSAVIEFFLNNNANSNATNNKGQTPLHIVCKHKSDMTGSIIKLLLRYNANIETLDSEDWTPLFVAGKKSNHFRVQCRLDNDANLYARNDKDQTPLRFAYKSRSDETSNIIQLLLKHNANIEAVDKKGWTPLFVACDNSHYIAVKYLLNKNANPNATDNKGRSPLHFVCRSVSVITPEIIQLLLKYNANIEAVDKNGWTPLFVACENSNYTAVKGLLNNHANPHHTDLDHLTPLYVAVKNHMDTSKVVAMLLERKVNVHGIDMWGDSIIHRIVNNCNEELIQRFAHTEVNFNSINKKGNTPLHIAVYGGFDNMTRTLIKYGANINILNKNNLTPLQSAIEQKFPRYEIIELLKIQVVKLNAAGLKVNNKDLNIIYNSNGSERNITMNVSHLIQLNAKCEQEIETMKREIIGIDNITFYDLLKSKIHFLSRLVNNGKIQETLEQEVYDNKFPLYIYIVRNRLREGKIRYKRYKLMNFARENFRLNINQRLPDECIDAVLRYFNIGELTTFIQATKPSDS